MALGKVAGLTALPMAEDAPPDLLAGGMDLRVVLPCGSVTRCNVDRSTPIMDLLVQLARAHRISPAAHTLQPFGLNNTPLHSQPSTPIGALDVFTVKIVPKARPLSAPGKRAAPRPTPAQPFEQTFRLQVHLPRNQLFVTRASRATLLGDIRALACSEKNLDPAKYELRHPANLDQRLDPESTLGECNLTEVALVAAGGRLGGGLGGLGGLGLSQPLPDIMALRRQTSKTAQFAFIGSHTMAADGSVSSASSGSLGGRSASPAPSDGERSTSPPALQPLQQLQPPSRPGRKRRPAPKPPAPAVTPSPATGPQQPSAMEMNNNINKEVINSGGTVISHSRNSSDSSGYHEASVLSESPEGGIGHTDSLPGSGRTGAGKLQSCVSQPNLNLSRSMNNLSMQAPLAQHAQHAQHAQQHGLAVRGNRNSIAVEHNVGASLASLGSMPGAHRASTSSLATAGQRKKKAPPPPPPGQQPRPQPNGSGPANSTSSVDPFLKTQSLERQGSAPAGPASAGQDSPDAPPQPRMTKSSTLPAALSASTAAPAPASSPSVGADSSPGSATGSSSSCPTPTPSDHSVHLSETSPPLAAPRPAPRVPLPRSVSPASPASPTSPAAPGSAPAPAPRPRPRKPIAPTPPTSPTSPSPSTPSRQDTTPGTPPRSLGAGFPTRSTSNDDVDAMSQASSSVFEDEMESIDKLPSANDPSIRAGAEARSSDEPRPSTDSVEAEALYPQVPNVVADKVQQTLVNHGEDAESDLGTADLSPPQSDIHDEESSLEHGSQSMDDNPNRNAAAKLSVSSAHSQVDEMSQNSTVSKDDRDLTKVSASSERAPEPQGPVEEEWEYRLPSPPSAFRDSRSHSPTMTEFDSMTPAETNLSLTASVKDWEEIPSHMSRVESPLKDSNTSLTSSELESEDKRRRPSSGDSSDKVESAPSTGVKNHQSKKSFVPPSTVEKHPTSETVINTGQSVINSTNVPNGVEKRKLEGSAAVLDELNKVLNEQRTSTLSKQQSVTCQSDMQLVQERAPIGNFSMAVYSRPTSAEGMPAPEVRPSLVLARRSSFSNSNGSLNTLSRPVSTGVRRTTSHATLVGGRREVNGSQDTAQSIDNLGSAENKRKFSGSGLRQDAQTLGRAVSAMNLCAEPPISPLEPELLKEFMEWRQQRQREQQEKEKQQKMVTSELQSPQVLRTILSQSQDDIREKLEATKEKSNDVKTNHVKPEGTECMKKATEEPLKAVESKALETVKRFVPRGPPSIQLSTWNERPKRQVSIKMDRDYWIGVGGAALRSTKSMNDQVDGAESRDLDTVSEIQQSHSSVPSKKEGSGSSKNNPSSETVLRLSKQYIVHTTPSGFRRPAEPVQDESTPVAVAVIAEEMKSVPPEEKPDVAKVPKLVNSVSTGALIDGVEKVTHSVHHQVKLQETTSVEIPVTSRNDPSRVPIVRAVELKKTPGVSTTPDIRKPLLRQNATTNSSVVYFSSGPVATSSVSGNNTKSVSVNHTNPSKPATTVKKFTSVVDISGPSTDKTMNGNSEALPVSHVPSVHVNGFASNPEPKRNLPMPVVKGFKLAQGAVNRQLSAPAATPPPPVPPPAPVMPVLKKVPRPSSLPAPSRVQDPREQLLDAIRNFGGRTKLRPTT